MRGKIEARKAERRGGGVEDSATGVVSAAVPGLCAPERELFEGA